MSLSIYDASAPVFIRAFGVLSALLSKAEAYATAHGLAPEELIGARLAPDMLTLAGQVQRASDTSKGAASRLTGADMPSFPDDEASFADLKRRIEKTVAYLGSLDPARFDGAESRPVSLKIGPNPVEFDGKSYLLTFALPNFFFHVTTAYAILRHKGLEIGKRDYLGQF